MCVGCQEARKVRKATHQKGGCSRSSFPRPALQLTVLLSFPPLPCLPPLPSPPPPLRLFRVLPLFLVHAFPHTSRTFLKAHGSTSVAVRLATRVSRLTTLDVWREGGKEYRKCVSACVCACVFVLRVCVLDLPVLFPLLPAFHFQYLANVIL